MEKKNWHRNSLHFTYKQAEKLTTIRHSCVVQVPHEMTLTMSPKFITNIRVGLKETLDKLLLTYNKELNGVPLAFNHIKVSSANIIDDLEVFKLVIKLSFIVFRPEPGKLLNGVVNKITDNHFGVIIHKCINASVRQPDRRVLSEAQKATVDNIEVGDLITFKIWKFDVHHGIIIVLGDIHAQCYQRIRRYSQSCSESEGVKTSPQKNKLKNELSTNCNGDFENGPVEKSHENVADDPDNSRKSSKKKKKIKFSMNDTDTDSQQDTQVIEKSPKKKRKKKEKNTTFKSPQENGLEIEVKKEILSDNDLFDNLFASDVVPAVKQKKIKKLK